ncbi:DUF1684 domain-containing protein [Lacinutrix sp. MEBiC02404]
MKNLFYLFIFISALSCAQEKQPLLGDTDWQREQNADFKDASKSPLKSKDRKAFRTLDFFKFDAKFVVTATLERTPDSEWFKMKTTTDRVSKERVYGVLSFQLNGKNYRLDIYQGQDLMQKKGFEDYLFLPFIDNTNGDTTYGGGRYIDLRIPEGDTLTLDFNQAYNPFCAYNEKFSCPIVPRNNYVDESIEAGVKAFVK